MCGVNAAEFPSLTASNFEASLASDEVLVHFLNNFLSLPTFPESLVYNQATGLFEVATGAAELISRRISSALHFSKSQLLTGDPEALARTPPVANDYAVSCLNKEHGFLWVVKERLPFFLQSDHYSEYRLAKLFNQERNLCIQRRKCSSVCTSLQSTPRLPSSSPSVIENDMLKVETCSQNPEETFANQGPSSSSSSSFSSPSSPNIKSEKAPGLLSSLIAPSLGNPQDERLPDSGSQTNNSSEAQLELLAASVVKQVLNNSLTIMDGQRQANTSGCFNLSGDDACSTLMVTESWEHNGCLRSASGVQGGLKVRDDIVREDERHTGTEEKMELQQRKCIVEGRVSHQENNLDCCHSSRPGLDHFKEFLRGTQGEKILNLWMDIERLRCTQNRQRKHRYLTLMRSWYLLSSSHSCLNVELLTRLGLTTPPCWTEEKLQSVKPKLTEAILHYWAPRFWSSRCVHDGDLDDPGHAGLWTDCCASPTVDMQLNYDYLTMMPDDHENHQPPPSSTVHHTQIHTGRGQLSSRGIETLLQALSVDLSAGSYITTFCEQSGNQMWENAINCWTDLQHYRELFYQEGLDPYRVQREAQLLYSTYLLTSAERAIDVDEELRREVCGQLTPPFEELFDGVEEHTLSILLEPWTLLVSRDRETFQKVCAWEEVRRVESREYRELQSLYQESERRLKQVEQWESVTSNSSGTPSNSHSKASALPQSWANVPPNYHGYRLGSILRYPEEISHFMSFLQDAGASIHLSCWLDLDKYRRSSQKSSAVRQERSRLIATKYLNRNYFFGPDSPATTQQQEDILHLAGGLERLTLDSLSNSVVQEIQDIIRSYIEEKWLPHFLSTTEFSERQQQQLKRQAEDGASRHVRRRRGARAAAVWKHGTLWMTSSKEILLFRRTLLNPISSLQFQHFVALKGEFLENDVLFWLEVQKYKDLCHSHSDDVTIQKKISTIISCFIKSSLPPALQIDVPPEQAQRILEKRKELGPYIFREAQMSVFSELLKFWPEFQELSSRVQEEQLLPLLQEKRVKHRARVRRQRRREEEAEEEEESERRRAQAVLARPKSNAEEVEEEEEEEEERNEGGEEADRREKRQLKTEKNSASPTQAQTLSWSYSKYMAALQREEALLQRRRQSQASHSTALDSSSDCSLKSAGSDASSLRPPRGHSDSRQWGRCNRRARVCSKQRVK